MNDIETEITGKTVEDKLLEDNSPAAINRVLLQQANPLDDNYEKLKREEVKTNWLRHEGTSQFITDLNNIRQDKLMKAENAAKNGHSEEALRLILQSASIRETMEIIKE